MGLQVWWSAVGLLAAFGPASVLAQTCVPLVTCPAVMESPAISLLGADSCSLPDGSSGVSCTPGSRDLPALSGSYLPPVPRTMEMCLKNRLKRAESLILKQLSKDELDDVVCTADKSLLRDEKRGLQLAALGENVAQPGSSEQLQPYFSRPNSKRSVADGEEAEASARLLDVLRELGAVLAEPQQEGLLAGRAAPLALPIASPADLLNDVSLLPNCTPAALPDCDPETARFRTHDGTCNHREQPLLGSAHTQYSRFFPSAYDDGVHAPRSRSVGGGALPSPRLVSSVVARNNDAGSDDVFRTIGLTLFGQFVDHDLTSTPEFALESSDPDETVGEGGGFSCCNADGSFPDEPLHPVACIPIRVPADDPVFGPQGVGCLNHVRSLLAPSEDCRSRPAAQQNQITHFVDGSNIYGSSDEESAKLRLFSGGQIRTTEPGRLLPRDEKRCSRTPDDCFISGDQRPGENIGLAFVHLVWTREHNRVAATLAGRHPDWDDERLYQEARRIVVGEYQHIVYNEFLPAVLGYSYTVEHGLAPGRGAGYDTDVPGTITSEFSTAAFRFGHSMVHDVFQLQAAMGRAARELALEATFFNSTFLLEQGLVRQLAVSLTSQRPGWVDRTFTSAVRERLFIMPDEHGLDLIVLNLNRGRDHGLPPYVTALENCGGRPVTSWEDLGRHIDADALARMRDVYDSYQDVDMYMGIVSERRATNAGVGPTLQCLIGQQFFDLRHGDRFFYDHTGLPNSFTEAQIRALQQASMSRVLCDNVPDLGQVQQLAFFQPGFFSNRLQACSSQAIPTVDMSLF